MKCPKCNKVMFSKYRDGGSVLICYNCIINLEQDFEMPNPDWMGNKLKPKPEHKTQATITLTADDVERIIRKYYDNSPMEINSVKFNIEGATGDHFPATHLKNITVETTLVL